MTVRSIAVRLLLSELSKRGFPASALPAMSAMPSEFSSDARFDEELVEDLLVQAVTVTGDAAFGLTWAGNMNPADWGLLYQLSAVIPTFSEAMATIVRFMPAYSDGATFVLRELPDRFIVEFSTRAGTEAGLRTKSEFGMRLVWEMFCGFVGPDARAHRVRFAFPAPSYRDEYERVFRSPCRATRKAPGRVEAGRSTR